MQPDLRARLEDAAGRAGRSLNAEITARLEASFSFYETLDTMDRHLAEFNESQEAMEQRIKARLEDIERRTRALFVDLGISEAEANEMLSLKFLGESPIEGEQPSEDPK